MWYQENSSNDIHAVMSKLFRNTVDTTTALFGALADITRAAAATAPYTYGKGKLPSQYSLGLIKGV